MDPSQFSSLLLLLIGKDNSWLPLLLIGFMVFQKWESIREKLLNIRYFGYSTVTFRAITYFNTSSSSTVGDVSLSIRALLHAIQPLVSPNKSSNQFTEFRIPYEELTTVFIPCNSVTLQLTPSIQVHFDTEYSFVQAQARESVSTMTIEMSRTKIHITLVSTKNMEDLNNYIQTIMKEYDQYVLNESKKSKYIVKPGLEKDKYTDIYKPVRIPLKLNKTFDTLFFPQKDLLIRRLNILKNPGHYAKL
jgi:hypothetical protein